MFHHALVACAVALVAPLAPAQNLRINEVLFDPPGPDTGNEYVEIAGDPGATIGAGTLLVAVQGGSPNQGDIASYFDLGGLTLGANGLLVLLQGSSPYVPDVQASSFVATGPGWTSARFASDTGDDLPNGSVTFLLVNAPSAPALSADFDFDNDGNPDNNPYFTWQILDSVGIGAGALSDAVYAGFNFVLEDQGQVIAGGTRLTACPLAYGYVGRVGASVGSTSRDWSGGFTAGTLPAFNLVPGRCYPPEFDGQAFDHVGAPNPPFPGAGGACEGDADANGVVNSSDLVFVIFRLGTTCP